MYQRRPGCLLSLDSRKTCTAGLLGLLGLFGLLGLLGLLEECASGPRWSPRLFGSVPSSVDSGRDRTGSRVTASDWGYLFAERHPADPAEPVDPLRHLTESDARPEDGAGNGNRLRLGFGCVWEPIPQQTWSGSAPSLLNELKPRTNVSDLGVHFPQPVRLALKTLHTRYRYGRLTTSWSYSGITQSYTARSLRRSIRSHEASGDLDAVVTVDTIARVPKPLFVYYDSTWDALITAAASLDQFAKLRLLTASEVLRQRDRQLEIFAEAAGVIAASHWLARSIVKQSGISAAKVHVVPLGGAMRGATPKTEAAAPGRRADTDELGRRSGRVGGRRLLFVGRMYEPYDFYRKGADLVVEALGILRREYDPHITLSMVGVDRWPMPGGPPEGVHLLGILPRDEIASMYDTHDLFVMPSRVEPFGIVFTEALSHGLPCVARNAYAMPEIVTPGVSGALIDKDDGQELAEAIVSVLSDEEIYKKCKARQASIAEYFSWDRVAREVVQVIERTLH